MVTSTAMAWDYEKERLENSKEMVCEFKSLSYTELYIEKESCRENEKRKMERET